MINTYRGLISATNSDTVESQPDESEIPCRTSDVEALFTTPLGHSLVICSHGSKLTERMNR